MSKTYFQKCSSHWASGLKAPHWILLLPATFPSRYVQGFLNPLFVLNSKPSQNHCLPGYCHKITSLCNFCILCSLPRHGLNYTWVGVNWTTGIFPWFNYLLSSFSERWGQVSVPSPLLHMHSGQHWPSRASWTSGKDTVIVVFCSLF